MSAVAKLLLAAGVRVSGSDRVENEQTRLLKDRGAVIFIGHAATNLASDIDLVIYTSAVPADNSERVEARRRGIRELTNFEFLGEWTKDKRTILVTGTHGKSTTTAMLGSILMEAKLNPTILVGSVVPGFSDGNIQCGSSDLWVIEGDEYARHFLAFHPFGVIINNLELDHTDIFSSLEDMVAAFRELLGRVQDHGVVVWNERDERVRQLMHEESERLEARGIQLVSFDTTTSIPSLHVPGEMNAMNARAAVSTARVLGVSEDSIAIALSSFRGIWRRFELLSDSDDVLVYSDYGHHPTAVAATLRAAHERYPERRIVLCFQPHQHNRTRHLFLDFVMSFDEADELVVCEIYDVAGREEAEDQKISSRDLVDAIIRHDADRGVARRVEYAENPEIAVRRIKELAKPGDCVIVMGAGDIDAAARSGYVLGPPPYEGGARGGSASGRTPSISPFVRGRA